MEPDHTCSTPVGVFARRLHALRVVLREILNTFSFPHVKRTLSELCVTHSHIRIHICIQHVVEVYLVATCNPYRHIHIHTCNPYRHIHIRICIQCVVWGTCWYELQAACSALRLGVVVVCELQCVAVCCSVLQVCCSVCFAVCYSVLWCVAWLWFTCVLQWLWGTCVLQCLQWVVVCCSGSELHVCCSGYELHVCLRGYEIHVCCSGCSVSYMPLVRFGNVGIDGCV